MTTIVTRQGKGAPLTYAEMDANFTNLNNDKVEQSDLTATNVSYTPTGTISATTVQAAIDEVVSETVSKTSNTGSAQLPVGTTAQQDGSVGSLRYNSDTDSFEGKTSTGYGAIGGGGGAVGGGNDEVFWVNGNTITADFTVTSGTNAGTFGPVTIADGVTVTMEDDSVWSIV